MAVNVGTIEAYLELRDRMTAALQNASKQLASFGDQAVQVGRKVSAAGQSMTLGISLPVAAAGAAVLKFASDFETGMTHVETLAGTARAEVDQMRGAVLKLSEQTGQGPEELAHALYNISSNGIKGKDAMDVLAMSAKAAAVGLGTTDVVAKSVVAALNVYSSTGLTAADATNKLFIAVKEGGGEADEFAGALGRVISIAKQANVSFDDILSSVATFTRLGVNADEAVTALRGTMTALIKPSADARKELSALGMSVDDLRKNVKEKGLAQALVDLVKTAHGDADAIAAIVPNVRALAGVLANASSQGGEYIRITKELRDNQDELGAAFQRTSETAGMKWNQFLATAKVAGIEFGAALVPAFKGALEQAKSFLDNAVLPMIDLFGKLPSPVQTAAFALGLVAAAVGPLTYGIGNLVTTFGYLAVGIGKVANAIPGVTVAMGSMAAAAGVAALAVAAVFAAYQIGQLESVKNKIAEITLALERMVTLRPMNWGDIKKQVEDTSKAVQDAGKAAAGASSSFDAMRDRILGISATKSIEDLSKILQEVTTKGQATPAVLGRIAEQAKLLQQQGATLTPQLAAMVKALQDTGDSADDATSGAKSLINELARAKDAYAHLTTEQQRGIAAGLAMGKNTQEIADKLKVSESVVEMYKTSWEATVKPLQEAVKANAALEAKLKTVTGVTDLHRATAEKAATALGEYGEQADKAQRNAAALGAGVGKLTQQLAEQYRLQDMHKREAVGTAVPTIGGVEVAQFNDQLAMIDKVTAAALAADQARKKSAEDNAVATLQFQLELDQKRFASQSKLRADTEALETAKKDAALAAENARFEAETAGVDKTGELYQQLVAKHQVAVDDIVAAWKRGVALRQASELGFVDSIKSALAQLPATILGALQGGGSVTKAIGGLFGGAILGESSKLGSKLGDAVGGFASKALGSVFGKGIGSAIGGALGSVIPGLGTIVGSLAGSLFSKIGGLFSGGEGHKTNQERDSWVAQNFGTKAQFEEVARAAGVTAAQLDQFEAHNRQGFEAAATAIMNQIQGVAAVTQKYGLLWTDFSGDKSLAMFSQALKAATDDTKALEQAGLSHQAALEKSAQGYIDLALQASKAGKAIPSELAPTILELAKMGAITGDVAAQMLGMANGNAVDFQAMTDAANRYGISLDALGPKFNAAKLADTANQLLADFNTLTQGGADLGAVIGGMADKVNEVVHQALKMGTDVPASMRDMLQKFLEAGQLTDQNGNKLMDLSQIHFAEPLEDAVQKLIDKMTELVNTIQGAGGALGDMASQGAAAAKAAADAAAAAANVPSISYPQAPIPFDPGAIPPLPPGIETVGAFANGGIVPQYFAAGGKVLQFTARGTDTVPAMLTPGERVLSTSDVAALGGQRGVSAAIANGGALDMTAVEDKLDAMHAENKALRADLRRAMDRLPVAFTNALLTRVG